MGIKDYIRQKYETAKKKHNEEVAYGKIVEAKATAAKRAAYAEEYTNASAGAARAKARADVGKESSRGSGGFFSGFVNANSGSFSNMNMPQGGDVMGNSPLFGRQSTPRIKYKRRTMPQRRKYYYAPIRHKPRRPQRKRIYYSAPKRHKHHRSTGKTVRQDTYGFGGMGW